MQWNLNVQHELAGNLTALVGYVGSRGVHMPSWPTTPTCRSTLSSAGYLWPSPVRSGDIINPNFGGESEECSIVEFFLPCP